MRITFHNVPPSDSSFILQGFLVDPGGYLLFSDLNAAGKGEGTMVLDLPGPAIRPKTQPNLEHAAEGRR